MEENKPKPKYKVGQWVKIVNAVNIDRLYQRKKIGKEGRISEVYYTGQLWMYVVKGLGYFSEEDMVLTDNQPIEIDVTEYLPDIYKNNDRTMFSFKTINELTKMIEILKSYGENN